MLCCMLCCAALCRCDWLNNKNTIFGKIVGDTIYNMLRFNDLEVSRQTPRVCQPVESRRWGSCSTGCGVQCYVVFVCLGSASVFYTLSSGAAGGTFAVSHTVISARSDAPLLSGCHTCAHTPGG
jgi:hypothetical protein